MRLAGMQESPTLSTAEQAVLKVADSMDGMRFCLNERRMGNQKIDHVFQAFASYVQPLLKGVLEENLFQWLVSEWRSYDGTFYE